MNAWIEAFRESYQLPFGAAVAVLVMLIAFMPPANSKGSDTRIRK